jgi:hypothetical protein
MDTNETNSLVITEEGGLEEVPVSMQVYQAIYNNITGKTEKITDTYNTYYTLKLSDLLNNHQLKQVG